MAQKADFWSRGGEMRRFSGAKSFYLQNDLQSWKNLYTFAQKSRHRSADGLFPALNTQKIAETNALTSLSQAMNNASLNHLHDHKGRINLHRDLFLQPTEGAKACLCRHKLYVP
ncbi:MAG: hypothetical protein J6C59_03125 [Muribaculaceae bacterium]|nr:hypothetical protein [Muribaculaceae bacterium]